MRSFTLLLAAGFLTLTSFAQNSATVTLVFVTGTNDNYKNYEAVIDDVSYYSESGPVNKSASNNGGGVQQNNRNTIWLNNFQAGNHTIQVYSLQNGTSEERSSKAPVYTSSFTVKHGFDTKIAVRNNGQVQFSQRQSVEDNAGPYQNADNNANDKKGDYVFINNDDDKNVSDNNGRTTPARNVNKTKTGTGNGTGNNQTGNSSNNKSINQDENNTGTNNDPGYGSGTTGGNKSSAGTNPIRKSSKRTSSTNNDGETGTANNNGVDRNDNNSGPNQNARKNRNIHDNKSNGGADDKMPMSDDQFNGLVTTIRKQWLPGAKIPVIKNEFTTSGHYFTTMQAKQVVELLTDEGNRLQMAKLSYHTVTDPENFELMDDLLTKPLNKNELDKYVRDYQY